MWWLLLCSSLVQAQVANEDYSSNEAVNLLQQYVQINTTTGNDLTPAVNFWQQLARDEGLNSSVYTFTDGFPIVVIKWPGLNSSLGSIMLNSHMDVVAAQESDGWTYPPFSAYLDEDGVIWGRGTQDMKSVAVQYYMALKNIKNRNVTLLRDVYMTFMPDEETGGVNGMVAFADSEEFRALNVTFEMDEGGPLGTSSPVIYQDKSVWQIRVDCYGTAVHGAFLPATNTTATGKCRHVMNSMLDWRDREYEKATAADIYNASSYTSINLNIINAGTVRNVIPSQVSMVFDIRLATNLNETDMDMQLRQLIAAAGDNITLTYLLSGPQSPATVVGAANPFWTALLNGATSSNLTIVPTVPPGATDARYLRAAGYPAFGFSPMPNTETLAHRVNERLSAQTFLAGIPIYEQIITNLANLTAEEVNPDPSTYLYYTNTS